jgi:hypothetical protein
LDGERQPGGADVLLGVPVVAGEREGGLRRRAEKRHVDDAFHAGGDGRVHGGEVLVDPVTGLAGGDEEQRADAVQSPPHGLRVGVGGRRHLGARQVRSARGVAHEEALGQATRGQPRGYPSAQPSGGAGDGVGGALGHVGR